MPIRPENRARYPRDWRLISYMIRFVRGGGQCECTGHCGRDHGGRCDARHGEPHPRTGSKVVLTTMHLNHKPEDCAPGNLLGDCQSCHNLFDAPMRQAGMKARRTTFRRKVLEKAGQMAFAIECETGRKVGR